MHYLKMIICNIETAIDSVNKLVQFYKHVILNNLLCFSINMNIYIRATEVTVIYFTPGFCIAFQQIGF